MTDGPKTHLRIASKKPLRSDGIGSFFQEYTVNERWQARLELRFASGARMSIPYNSITEINFTFLKNGEEDITLFSQYKSIIRIIGKDFDKLFDSLHKNNIKWLRETRLKEQYDPEQFFIDRIKVYRTDDWFKTLDDQILKRKKAKELASPPIKT